MAPGEDKLAADAKETEVAWAADDVNNLLHALIRRVKNHAGEMAPNVMMPRDVLSARDEIIDLVKRLARYGTTRAPYALVRMHVQPPHGSGEFDADGFVKFLRRNGYNVSGLEWWVSAKGRS